MALVKSNIPWAEKIEAYPEQNNSLTYTGSSLSPTWKNYDSKKMEMVGGTASAVNAGTYYTNFAPLRRYVFPDGTKQTYPAEWKIAKAVCSLSFSEDSG